MNNSKKYWEEIHKKDNSKINLDKKSWISKYEKLIKPKTNVLDLGCGDGNNCYYFLNKNLNLYACDFSENALNKVKQISNQIKTINCDISKKLPFKSNFFDFILADLSLHYFSEIKTKKIILEIKRILKKGGYLLARVNSVYDLKNKSKNYIFIDGCYRRFFSDEKINYFFSEIGELKLNKNNIIKYGINKTVFDILAKKKF